MISLIQKFILPILLLLSCTPQAENETGQIVIKGALEQIGKTVRYDPSYQKIPYPGGDVPLDRGVCTDVVIRAFRKAGIDLQLLVQEDIRKSLGTYLKNLGFKTKMPDPNIAHRRVPNLMTFFKRQGKSAVISSQAKDYLPADIVVWKLTNGLNHIGIVSDRYVSSEERYLIVHNIGAGAQLEDILFKYKVIGHYRFF